MASSMENPDDILKINEILYTDSYFKLLKNKNNPKESADDFRDIIRQMNFHCSIQNINSDCSNKLKSRFISEYTSLIDSQNHEGLLPVISDDLNVFRSLSKHDPRIELSKARTLCMETVKNIMSTYETRVTEKSVKSSCSIDGTAAGSSNAKARFGFHSKPESTSWERKNTPSAANLDNKLLKSTSANVHWNVTSTSNASLLKNQPIKRLPNQIPFENSQKKRTIESSDIITRSSKKQFNQNNYKQNSDIPANSDSLKNSFIPASSMYKNPLKKACHNKEEESSNNLNDLGGDVKNHPLLKNFDPKIVGIIMSEIMDFSPDVKWSDIAGLEFVKSTVQEIVIWPLLRPDIFTGLRAPPRGILLFGPPGTGKTLIGKCIATESNSTFFCISASSLASKWVGESEQLVRALFAVAQLNQPAVIFIDEIDSLLSQRSDQEQDHTRKLKTEFLVQFDGAKTNEERRVLVVGATNRPHELDEAARRRFVKRLYVPLPEESARLQIIEKLLHAHQHNLSSCDLKKICEETKGYSGSDVAHLCKEAAMGPIRSIGPEQIKTVSLDQVRAIELIDFLDALKQVRASVAQEDLNYYLDWNKKFGSFAI